MNLKKTAILVLTLAIAVGFGACGKKDPATIKSADPTSDPTQTVSEAPSAAVNASSAPNSSAAPKVAATPLPPSSNKTVVKDAEAPKVYWATENRESTDVAFHLKDCPTIKDKNPGELSWEMVKTLGFRQCPVCKPPKYEGYVD